MKKTILLCVGINSLFLTSTGMATIAGYSFEIHNESGAIYADAVQGSVPISAVEDLDIESGTLSIISEARISDESLKAGTSAHLIVNQSGASDFTNFAQLNGLAKAIFQQLGVVENTGGILSGFLQVGVQVDGVLSVSIDTIGSGFADITNLSGAVTLVSETPGAEGVILDELIGFSGITSENNMLSDELLVDSGLIELPLFGWSEGQANLISLALTTISDIGLGVIDGPVETSSIVNMLGTARIVGINVLDENHESIPGAEFVFISESGMPEPSFLLPFMFGVVIPLAVLRMRRRHC